MSILRDPALAAELFRKRYRRPPPWSEPIAADALEQLSWTIGERLKLQPPFPSLDKTLRAAWDRIAAPARAGGACRGSTEPLPSAAARFSIPTDGLACLVAPLAAPVRIRTRDVIEFDGLLWTDDSWLIDENASWLLAGMHDYPAYFLRLS